MDSQCLAVPVVLAAGYGLARVGEAPTEHVAAEPNLPDVAEYPSMTALRKVEPSTGYDLTWKITDSPLVVVAPHGGGIEVRTSEIASAVAGALDVEECLILIRQRPHALSIHGTSLGGKIVYVGGRDTAKGAQLIAALIARGFDAQLAPDSMAGLLPANFVNKDADGAGVQLELTQSLRLELFPTAGGAAGPKVQAFVDAVQSVYP